MECRNTGMGPNRSSIILRKQYARKRYKLHKKMRELGLKVNARARTVFIPSDSELVSNPAVKEYASLGNNVQITIS